MSLCCCAYPASLPAVRPHYVLFVCPLVLYNVTGLPLDLTVWSAVGEDVSQEVLEQGLHKHGEVNVWSWLVY